MISNIVYSNVNNPLYICFFFMMILNCFDFFFSLNEVEHLYFVFSFKLDHFLVSSFLTLLFCTYNFIF